MAKLSRADVEHVAELAKLALSETEKAIYREQLSTILDYIATLQTVDTDDIAPTATVLPLRNVLRPDSVRPSLPREAVLHNAPNREAGQFRVESILE